jgi:hypothetical protein
MMEIFIAAGSLTGISKPSFLLQEITLSVEAIAGLPL